MTLLNIADMLADVLEFEGVYAGFFDANKFTQDTSKAFEKAFLYSAEVIEQDAKDISDAIAREMARTSERIKEYNQASEQSVEIKFPDTAEISQQSAKAMEPIKKAAEKTSKNIESSLSSVKVEVPDFNMPVFEIPTDPIERARKELENIEERIGILREKWRELQRDLGEEQTDSGANNIISQINSVENQMLSLQVKADKTSEKLNGSLGNVTVNVNPIAKAFEKIKSFGNKAFNNIKKVGSASFKALKSVANKVISGISSKFSGLKKVFANTSKPLDRLGNSLKRAAKSVLLMAGAYAVFRGLKTLISDSCKQNDEFVKSLNEVGANLRIAFQPIMDSVMPLINTLMSGLSAVTKSMAVFINELFGSTYNKSLETLKKAETANKKAQSTAKSTFLASFDEMNVAQDSSNSSESDSEDNSIDYSAINGDNVKLTDWAERMKDAIKSGDWTGVGALLSEKVNSVFNIDWTAIQNKVNAGFKAISDGLNGFISTLDWGGLGDTVADGVNTVFGGIHTFLTTVDWTSFGKGLAKSLNNAVKKANWELIAKTFSAKWNALIDTLFAFVTDFDWSMFGLSIGESINTFF